MPLDLIDTLSHLVAIPSINPMGRSLAGPEFLEYRVTEYLQGLFDELGLPWQRQRIEERRDNIVARLDGDLPVDAPGGVLMFEAHQDTVPVDGMSIDPFSPQVRDGRLYGRGACDIKGGMTAMLVALSRLAEERPAGRPTLLMACTVNEEHGYSGAKDLARLWSEEGESIFPRRPDAAIVAEPTDINVVVAHKGAVRWRCRTKGRATHSSQPHQGENAIYKMSRVIQCLETYHRDYLPTLPTHPLCGAATLSVGTISGGISVNTVPDECRIEIDRRLLPGEENVAVYRQVIDFVNSQSGISDGVQHESPFMDGATLADETNGPLSMALLEHVREVVGKGERIGVPYGTDASKIAAAGVPSVVFGPGSINQAHTADEWVPLEELKLACEVLYRFGRARLVPTA